MMFSDDEIKEEGNFTRPGDKIISIREVYLDLDEKFDKKDLGFRGEGLLANPSKHDVFRDGFFPFSLESGQARFAWTEEDGAIAALVSEPGFGTGTDFGKDLDAALKSQMKEADTSSSVPEPTKAGSSSTKRSYTDLQTVTSTSSTATSSSASSVKTSGKSKPQACKVDKTDPRSRFHFVKYIKRHGRTVRLWECGICSREFQHQYTLMRHLPTHTDERNFHCEVCDKSFRQLSTLSQHRAIHSKDRPYSCEICHKTFNRVSTLISHRKTHSEQKLYRCHLCPKGFHQKGNLRNHLFTHTNERPYRCDVCNKGFNQQSNLVCHKNKAHPEDCTAELNIVSREAKVVTPCKPASKPDSQPDSTLKPSQQCEVSSSSHLSPWQLHWDAPLPSPRPPSGPSSDPDVWTLGSGVLVEPIKTFHMGVALATKQTPFALLHADDGAPVLVKVVDTMLPGGKQMLVPATAEDLRIGGRIVLNNDGLSQPVDYSINPRSKPDEKVQIRVPVVATVVPRYRPGGGLQLTVEEPHHAYHTALSTDGQVGVEPCVKPEPSDPRPVPGSAPGPGYYPRRLDPPPLTACPALGQTTGSGSRISSSCLLPPPSPPLDLISMDLFEPMQCLPMGKHCADGLKVGWLYE